MHRLICICYVLDDDHDDYKHKDDGKKYKDDKKSKGYGGYGEKKVRCFHIAHPCVAMAVGTPKQKISSLALVTCQEVKSRRVMDSIVSGHALRPINLGSFRMLLRPSFFLYCQLTHVIQGYDNKGKKK